MGLVYTFILIFTLIFSQISAQKLDINNKKNPIVISHRGAGNLAPENSLLAINTSLLHKINFIEIDIRLTKDNEIILMHDKRLNRTSNGSGLIRKKEISYINKLKLRGDSNSLSDEKIPTLSEALRLLPCNSKLIIDVKVSKDYALISDLLGTLIEEFNKQENVIVMSFNYKFIQFYKSKYPTHHVGIITFCNINRKILSLNIEYVSVNWRFAKSIIRKTTTLNLNIFAWGVNERNIKKMSNYNIDGFITNEPLRIKSFIKTLYIEMQ